MRARILPRGYYTDQSPYGRSKYDSQGVSCGPNTASGVFFIFTTQQDQCLSVLLLFALVSDETEVFIPKYSQIVILHAAHFRRVVIYAFFNRWFAVPFPIPNDY